MQIEKIANITGGNLVGVPSRWVRQLSTDSRSLPGTVGVMFIAIRGDNHNGNDYIDDAYQQGIRIFMTDRTPSPERYPEASFCIVPDSLSALQALASNRRESFGGLVIGVTGSNGKTIVKEWLYQSYQYTRKTTRSPRSYNSQLGVPLSVWQLSESYDTGIIEAGISLPGEMDNLEPIIRPQIGILTNIGPAHSENFSSDSEKLKEKLKLFNRTEKLIFRSDQEVDAIPLSQHLEGLSCKLVGWSLGGHADYSYRIGSKDKYATEIELDHTGEKFVFSVPFTDEASLENALHVVTVLFETGVEPGVIRDLTGNLEPVEMRLEILKGIYGSTLVNDVYNSDLAGLGVALDVLFQLKSHSRKAVILSDVYQSGMDKHLLYQRVAGLLEFKGIQKIVCIGEDISFERDLFPADTLFFPDTSTFLKEIDDTIFTGYAVLIKGARKFQFEEITAALQLQYHKTLLTININNMISNLNYFRSLLNPETMIMAMVKAFSYGAGSYEVSEILQHQKIDYLAVAFADEGARLRKAGITLPIMVMNTGEGHFRLLLENRLEPEIYSREGLTAFINECRYMGLTEQRIHIKLDTGMHRLGFGTDDIEWIRQEVSRNEIRVASIFSHLAASDQPGLDAFTRKQIELFKAASHSIVEVLDHKPLLHILNSAGTERFPEYQFDMVRIGIGMYGQGVEGNLKNVSTFTTRISQLRNVTKGETVGYGRVGTIDRDSVIATIPVGYADGIDRRLGNGRYAFILNGQEVPTVGNICMDMTMIDVTGIDATVGDIVELFGENCPVSKMAAALDTIVYEIMTSIPERVKRVYTRE